MKIENEIDNERLGGLIMDAANSGYEITDLRGLVTHMLSCCANSDRLWELIAYSDVVGIDPSDFEEHGVWIKDQQNTNKIRA